MASEWVGVIGTAIGAGIGGVVTVANQIIRGRQELANERERRQFDSWVKAQDHKWEARRHNFVERQALYEDILSKGTEVSHLLAGINESNLHDKDSDGLTAG